jgi:hypothetical protein
MSEIATQDQPKTETAEQTTLLDLGGKQIFRDFYDDKTPVFIPNNPLHFKAHKLEILIKNMEAQSVKNAAQFNSKNYLDAVDALMKCYEDIKEKYDEYILEQGVVAANGDASTAPTVGNRNAPSVGAGISADNPLTRQRPNTV